MRVLDGKRYGTGSVSDLSIDHVATLSMLRSLTLPVPYRRSRHFPVYAIASSDALTQFAEAAPFTA